MEEGIGMEQFEPRDEIARLEGQIEELAAKLENCRKFILAARAAIALGGLLMIGIMVGAIRSDAAIMAIAVVAAIGGVVLLGSNRSTAMEASAQLADVERRRAALITLSDPQVVSDKDAAGVR
jgi:hypothetical protein